MISLLWKFSYALYQKLGPKNAWRFAMSPIPKFLIFSCIALFGQRVIKVKTKYGFLMNIKLNEYLIAGYFHLGETNPHETHVLRSLLKPGDIMFDIGAYKGWYALNASQCVKSQGKVYAFEPNPDVAKSLKENITMNHFKNIIVEEIALSDTDTTTDFWIGSEDMLGSLKKDHVARSSKKKVTKVAVPVMKLDTFVLKKRIKKIHFIKIDVEGNDLEVLQGAKKTLEEYSPTLLVEVFGLSAVSDKKRAKKIIMFLKRIGYIPYEFVGNGIRVYSDLTKEPGIINILFVKKENSLKQIPIYHG